MKKLKTGKTAGLDGVAADHLKLEEAREVKDELQSLL